MSAELSKILEHVETMNKLDLEGVEPTSHVVELQNVLRDDVPRPSLPREQALERAPTWPTAASECPARGVVSDLLALTAGRQAERIRAGEVSGEEVFEFWRERARGRRARLVPLGGRTRTRAGELPPVAVKDLFCVEGVPSAAGSRILEGYRRPTPRRACATSRRRRAGARQDQPGRVRDGLSNENSGFGPVQNPWDRDARAGRLERRQRRRGGGRHGALGDRHRHRRLDPPARLAVRHRRPQAHLRRGQPLRHDRLRLVARPVRPAHPRRDGRRPDAARARGAATHATPPRSASRRRSSCRAPSGSTGSASASWGLEEEGLDPGVADVCRRTLALIEELGGTVDRDRPAERPPRHRRLLRDRPRRGERQPRPLRRRPLRPIARRQRRPPLDVRADPPRGLRRRRSSAAS